MVQVCSSSSGFFMLTLMMVMLNSSLLWFSMMCSIFCLSHFAILHVRQ